MKARIHLFLDQVYFLIGGYMRTDKDTYILVKEIFEHYNLFRSKASVIDRCITNVRENNRYTLIFDKNALIAAKEACLIEIDKVNSALESVSGLDERLSHILRLAYINHVSYKIIMAKLYLKSYEYYRDKQQAINLFLDCYMQH